VRLARVVRCRTGCDTTGNRQRSVRRLLVLPLLVGQNLLVESLLRDVFVRPLGMAAIAACLFWTYC
jgi:hypothetical protein